MSKLHGLNQNNFIIDDVLQYEKKKEKMMSKKSKKTNKNEKVKCPKLFYGEYISVDGINYLLEIDKKSRKKDDDAIITDYGIKYIKKAIKQYKKYLEQSELESHDQIVKAAKEQEAVSEKSDEVKENV